MSTLPAPMEPSNRSVSPRREAQARLAAMSRRVRAEVAGAAPPRTTAALACFTAPLVLRKARDRLAMTFPRQRMTMRGDSVTAATG